MTCPHCDAGFPRAFGEHFNLTRGARTKLGPCTAPDDAKPAVTVDRFRERLAAWVERVHAPVVAEVLMAAPADRERVLEHYLDDDKEAA
jgi:hypothetical protein